MKKLMLVALIAITISGCKKDNECATIEAKLVASFCAYNVVQITDPNSPKLGTSWTDGHGNTFSNAFSVKNYCDFSKSNLMVGDTFKCKIVKSAKDNQCVVCMGFMETPALGYHIEVLP